MLRSYPCAWSDIRQHQWGRERESIEVVALSNLCEQVIVEGIHGLHLQDGWNSCCNNILYTFSFLNSSSDPATDKGDIASSPYGEAAADGSMGRKDL